MTVVAVTLGGAVALMVAKVGVMLVEGTLRGGPWQRWWPRWR